MLDCWMRHLNYVFVSESKFILCFVMYGVAIEQNLLLQLYGISKCYLCYLTEQDRLS